MVLSLTSSSPEETQEITNPSPSSTPTDHHSDLDSFYNIETYIFPQPDPFLDCLRNAETKLGRKLRDMEILRIELRFDEWVGNRFWYSAQSTSVASYYKDFRDWKSWVDVRQGEEDPEEFLVRIFVRGLRDEIKTRVRMVSPTSVAEAFKIASRVEAELKDDPNMYDEMPSRKFPTTISNASNKEPKDDHSEGAPIIPQNIDEDVVLQVLDDTKEKLEFKEISFSWNTNTTEFVSPSVEVYCDSIFTHKANLIEKADPFLVDRSQKSSSLVQVCVYETEQFRHLRFQIVKAEEFLFGHLVGLSCERSKYFIKDALKKFGNYSDWLFVGIIELRAAEFCTDGLENFNPHQDSMIFHKWRDRSWLIFGNVYHLITNPEILGTLFYEDAAIFHKWKEKELVLYGCCWITHSVILGSQKSWFTSNWIKVLPLWNLLPKGDDCNEVVLSMDHLVSLSCHNMLLVWSLKSIFITFLHHWVASYWLQGQFSVVVCSLLVLQGYLLNFLQIFLVQNIEFRDQFLQLLVDEVVSLCCPLKATNFYYDPICLHLEDKMNFSGEAKFKTQKFGTSEGGYIGDLVHHLISTTGGILSLWKFINNCRYGTRCLIGNAGSGAAREIPEDSKSKWLLQIIDIMHQIHSLMEHCYITQISSSSAGYNADFGEYVHDHGRADDFAFSWMKDNGISECSIEVLRNVKRQSAVTLICGTKSLIDLSTTTRVALQPHVRLKVSHLEDKVIFEGRWNDTTPYG